MGKIFKEYGGTIITVIAVVLLISFVTTSMNTGGVLYNAFGSMINSLSEKSNDMVNAAAGGSGEGKEAGWPVSWNTMDVTDNPKVDMGDGTYLVKVSDYTPTAEELTAAKMTVAMGSTSVSMFCLYADAFADGLVGAQYDEEGNFMVLSVSTTEEVDGLQFPETGLWTIDYGSLGMDADVKVEVVPVLTEITELVDGVVVYDADSSIYYATSEATLIKFGLDTSAITYSTAGLPESYVVADGDIVGYGALSYQYAGESWSVANVTDKSKSSYRPIVKSIFDYSVDCIGTGNQSGGFANCTNLESIGPVGSGASLEIPDSVTTLCWHAFSGCTSLSSIAIPNSVTRIGNYALNGCTSLTSVTIPDGASVASWAFNNCTNLTSLTIGNSVTSIGNFAFSGCTSLTSITFEGTVEQWNAIEKDDNWYGSAPATEVVCSNGVVSLVD